MLHGRCLDASLGIVNESSDHAFFDRTKDGRLMLALGLCFLAFVLCYFAGRRSLGKGLVAVLVFGYFYGILRANLLTSYSHFIFDAGLLGLYLSQLLSTSDLEGKKRSEPVVLWTVLLILWPVLLVAMPFQPLLVSLVGLRGNIYFILLLLLGARLKGKDVVELSVGLAVLDLVALGFAVAEYVLGVPKFFPLSPVTMIMYSSNDVAGGFLRIPSTFANAHAFGGTMVSSIPFLIGLWTGAEKRFCRFLGLIGIPAAMLGMLLSATRLNFVIGAAMVSFVLFTTKMKAKHRFFFVLIIAAVAFVALSDARMQRFKTLDDAGYVSDRIAGSVNRGFWEILTEYPMGNGMGGGGTSMPYFLEGQVKNPIGMENEYARILSEQGIIGFLLWLSFLIWFFCRSRVAFAQGSWMAPRRLIWCMTAFAFATAWIGTGALTSIPGTLLLMLGMGWVLVPPEPAAALPRYRVSIPFERSRRSYIPARP